MTEPQASALPSTSCAATGEADGSSPGSNKRRADGEGAGARDSAAVKRSRPAEGGDGEQVESADDAMGMTMKDVDQVPIEMRVTVLRSRALEMEEEVKRLRNLIQARESEFAEERKQLVGKLMASEQARREGEAALETNDAMWQQLVQNQMAALQQKIAAQQQRQTIDCGAQDKGDAGASAETAIGAAVASGQDPLRCHLSGEDEQVEEEAQGVEQRDDVAPQSAASYAAVKCGEAGDAQGTSPRTSEEESNTGEEEHLPTVAQPLSPASSLVAKWASKRRRTIGGCGDGDGAASSQRSEGAGD